MKKIIFGFLLGSLFFGMVNAYASSSTLIEVFHNIKGISINGKDISLSEKNPAFIYNGLAYVPLRMVTQELEKSVQWNAETQTIKINNSDCIQQSTTSYKELKNICVGYKNVELPLDYYVDGLLISRRGKEQYLPALTVKYHKSELTINTRKGIVINRSIDPGDAGAFQFLDPYILGYDE